MSAAPELHFGAGSLESLPSILRSRGLQRILLVISRSALSDLETRAGLRRALEEAGIHYRAYRYDRLPDGEDPWTADRGGYGEASPEVVDAVAALERGRDAEAVVAIGGGSAVDTGKALSAALRHEKPIATYLEGVGTESPTGRKLPFIAVPTTAGTGTEATMNAVLASVGKHGFKKSLRHPVFVPDVAVIDPSLQLGCPRAITAASGMDAIAQLLEAYVSTNANPLTDALALDGLAAAGRSFLRAVDRGESDIDARAGMAYAAYLSGSCLANAGLGVVHGLAGPAGGHAVIPHGVFCGALLGPATEMLMERLVTRRDAMGVLSKFAAAGRVLSGRAGGSLEARIQMLLDRIAEFTRSSALPGLASFGFDDRIITMVAAEGNSKNSPVQFSEAERVDLLRRCL